MTDKTLLEQVALALRTLAQNRLDAGDIDEAYDYRALEKRFVEAYGSEFSKEDYDKLVEVAKAFKANIENKRDGLLEVIEDEGADVAGYLRPIVTTYRAVLTDFIIVERAIKP